MNKQGKQYDLEERTRDFARECRKFVKQLEGNKTINFEDGKQLVRSSGSVAANYIEANESLSKKDFKHRIKICRKEAKESNLWLDLCDNENGQEDVREELMREANELMKIFGSILKKSE
jgi:four helix bundle protein